MDNYDMYWGIITYKSGTQEAIITTSEEAYYAYEIYYEGSRVSMPNYGYLDCIKDFDDEMLSEVNFERDEVDRKKNEKLLQEAIAQRKIMRNMTNKEKVTYLLSQMEEE
jgi:hypothetical protein